VLGVADGAGACASYAVSFVFVAAFAVSTAAIRVTSVPRAVVIWAGVYATLASVRVATFARCF